MRGLTGKKPMKSLFVICFALFQPLFSNAQGHHLTVVIQGVKNGKGVVRVALYDRADKFMKEMQYSGSVKASAGEVHIELEGIAEGYYAASVVHDANDNGKMDATNLGIPKEGFGFSNNARGTFGPPPFDDAKFLFNGQHEIIISLTYY